MARANARISASVLPVSSRASCSRSSGRGAFARSGVSSVPGRTAYRPVVDGGNHRSNSTSKPGRKDGFLTSVAA
jgi:hypothetical protein